MFNLCFRTQFSQILLTRGEGYLKTSFYKELGNVTMKSKDFQLVIYIKKSEISTIFHPSKNVKKVLFCVKICICWKQPSCWKKSNTQEYCMHELNPINCEVVVNFFFVWNSSGKFFASTSV